ncbi:unnamed protein product [Cuscuta europaea]|uniref:Retrotransposon gag domain-containing protein n=1 Tax=Cuscuta europaea TaxID=41803 RepID=A0A9P0ZIE6_CUSEU|nr:unnamed protein product [Cuscuta europaea]
MIVAWIFNTIDPSLRSSISYRDSARDLREDIRQRFSVGNGVKIYQLKCELTDCKQRSGESIMTYFNRLKKLWDDVNDYDALPSCSCNGCRCGITVALLKRRADNQVREFLMGLGLEPYYAAVRSNLLGRDTLPSLNLVYSRLIQEEEVRAATVVKTEATAPMTFAVRGPVSNTAGRGAGGAGRGGRSPLLCTHTSRKMVYSDTKLVSLKVLVTP